MNASKRLSPVGFCLTCKCQAGVDNGFESLHPNLALILIIGGPCGLIMLWNLTERGEYETVELARRDNVGSVWHHQPLTPVETVLMTNSRTMALGMIGSVLPECRHPFPPQSSTTPPVPCQREDQVEHPGSTCQ
jgi:hypothetical protein